jgi:hypothetical protein
LESNPRRFDHLCSSGYASHSNPATRIWRCLDTPHGGGSGCLRACTHPIEICSFSSPNRCISPVRRINRLEVSSRLWTDNRCKGWPSRAESRSRDSQLGKSTLLSTWTSFSRGTGGAHRAFICVQPATQFGDSGRFRAPIRPSCATVRPAHAVSQTLCESV